MSEGALQNYVIAQAKKHGLYCRKMASPGRRGFPDMLIAINGHAVFIELKNPNGKGRLSKIQNNEIRRIQDAGLSVLVLQNRKEIDDVIRTVANHEATGGDQ